MAMKKPTQHKMITNKTIRMISHTGNFFFSLTGSGGRGTGPAGTWPEKTGAGVGAGAVAGVAVRAGVGMDTGAGFWTVAAAGLDDRIVAFTSHNLIYHHDTLSK